MKKEKIANVPNFVTLIRLIITPIIIYFVVAGYDLAIVSILFITAMLTDFFDGQIARRYDQKTEFGRKFDIIADRILLLGTILAFVINFYTRDSFTILNLSQISLVLSREAIAFPFAIYGFVKDKRIPKVRLIGKATTLAQGLTFPLIILSTQYESLVRPSIFFSVVTFAIGLISAGYYATDIINEK